jgi:hypothetical protein
MYVVGSIDVFHTLQVRRRRRRMVKTARKRRKMVKKRSRKRAERERGKMMWSLSCSSEQSAW